MTNIASSPSLVANLTLPVWVSRVQIFLRFRDLAKQDLAYEELIAAYRSHATGAHWYHLASGHLIAESGVTTHELRNLERDFELVYERRGAKSELHSLPC